MHCGSCLHEIGLELERILLVLFSGENKPFGREITEQVPESELHSRSLLNHCHEIYIAHC